MKYALIGCGRISLNHIEAARCNGLDFVAMCDLIPEMMKEKSDRLNLGDVRKYIDYKEMLAREKPELVAIATESGKHAAIALDCIAAGCHVIIEKPIALSLADADAVLEAGKRNGVVVCVSHQNRFNRSIQYIHAAMKAGRFGRLLHGAAHVRWNRGKNYYDQAKWRGSWAQDGGCLMNQCIHSVDLLRWMMGDEVEEVIAYTDQLMHPYLETEDLGMAMLKFANGSYGLIEGSTNIYPENLEETLYLFGEKGTVKAGGISDNQIEVWRFADGLDDSEVVRKAYSEHTYGVYGNGHTRLYADMIEAIQTGREPLVDAAAGRRAIELVLAIYQSAAEHRPVRLPLARGATMDFVGRFEKDEGSCEGGSTGEQLFSSCDVRRR